MQLKCIKKCDHFTLNNYYNVIDYKYNEYYIVIDDDNKQHYISINFTIDYFTEV